jgi:hypothetical protein
MDARGMDAPTRDFQHGVGPVRCRLVGLSRQPAPSPALPRAGSPPCLLWEMSQHGNPACRLPLGRLREKGVIGRSNLVRIARPPWPSEPGGRA